PVPVFVDHDLWEKVVLNLLSNALKFTFQGKIRVKLQVGTQVELSVTDTGTGIPAAELPHVFERFRRMQGARARSQEGSGIGLALVDEIARLHGGSVAAVSELGRGSTFFVRIPIGKAHLPANRIAAPSAQPSTARAAGPYVEEVRQWIAGAAKLGID